MNEVELTDDGKKLKLKREVADVLYSVRLAIGLQGLLWLQYDNEGHVNCEVASLLRDTTAGAEEELSKIAAGLIEETVPF